MKGDKLAIAWKVDGGSGPPIMAGGAVWALGYDGKLRAVDPATGKVLFSAQLGLRCPGSSRRRRRGAGSSWPMGDRLAAFALR